MSGSPGGVAGDSVSPEAAPRLSAETKNLIQDYGLSVLRAYDSGQSDLEPWRVLANHIANLESQCAGLRKDKERLTEELEAEADRWHFVALKAKAFVKAMGWDGQAGLNFERQSAYMELRSALHAARVSAGKPQGAE